MILYTQTNSSPSDFTDHGFWTPQTFMLQSIRSWINTCAIRPADALSIDQNPTLDEILCAKWPQLRITRAMLPH